MTSIETKKGTIANLANLDTANGPQNNSRALQEIIDILKYPFQVSCSSCKGLGFIKSGEDCKSCRGTGMVLEDFFR